MDLLEEGSFKEKAKEVGVKVLFDNLFFQAPFLTCYFLITGALEGLQPSAVYEKTQKNFHAAWFYAVLLWGPVQTLNFWLVPVPLQPLVVNLVNAGWKTCLSVLYHARDYGGEGGGAQPLSTEVEGVGAGSSSSSFSTGGSGFSVGAGDGSGVDSAAASSKAATTALRKQVVALTREVETQRLLIQDLRRELQEAKVTASRPPPKW